MTLVANRQALAGEKNKFLIKVPQSTKLTIQVNIFGCLLGPKDGQNRVHAAGQDLELDLLENTKEIVLLAKGLKTVGGAK
jgi:hypothetical protein